MDREADARVARMDARPRPDAGPFSEHVGQIATIPGVNKLSGLSILSETGVDISRFETAGHLVAWAGLCPGHNESAGKRKGARLRKGPPREDYARPVRLGGQARKEQLLSGSVLPPGARRGPQKAICAVAAAILTAIYHMLKTGTFHHDLGADYFNRRSPQSKIDRLVRQIAKLGYDVTLQPTTKTA